MSEVKSGGRRPFWFRNDDNGEDGGSGRTTKSISSWWAGSDLLAEAQITLTLVAYAYATWHV